MADHKKLDRWADKLLDTGKRNNLISFKDTKASTVEILFPDCESIFSRCAVGHIFEVFDPKIPDTEPEGTTRENDSSSGDAGRGKKLTREEYRDYYSPKIKSKRNILVYAQTPNPMMAVKNIARRAREMQDETGINVAYLAFGFLKWNEKDGSKLFYRAPLLLVHVNVITGSILDSVKIEVSDDDVIVNPTFNYYLESEYGVSLPDHKDGDSLATYYSKVAYVVSRMGWEVVDECKLGIFSFLKINMYEDLKQNADRILQNGNVQALLGEKIPDIEGVPVNGSDEQPVDEPDPEVVPESSITNPLIDLHTVVDADSSQIEAIEMAKSGKSFVLQGPPGTGKSQTITNIIAECLHDGKKVLFVSEKQAALNVVYEKLKKAGLADFCLELHSHKANKKAVIEELNRILEMPKSSVSSGAQEEIRQKQEAQFKLDSYASALHRKREPVGRSLYQLFELYSAQKEYPDVPYMIYDIESRGQDYLLRAIRLLEQYVEYVPSVGQNYHENAWYGFTDKQISYGGRLLLKSDLESLSHGYRVLQDIASGIQEKYGTQDLNYTDVGKWQSLLAFLADSDVVTPSILSREAYGYARPHLSDMQEISGTIVPLLDNLLNSYTPEIFEEVDGRDIYTKLTGQYSSFFSRLFSGDYKNLAAGLQLYRKDAVKLKYPEMLELAEQLMKLQSATKIFEENEKAVPGSLGSCYKGPYTDWIHVMDDLDILEEYFNDGSYSFDTFSAMSPEIYAENQAGFRADADRLHGKLHAVEHAMNRVKTQFSPVALNPEKDPFEDCVRKLEGCLGEFDSLGNWISFMNLSEQMTDADLSMFLDMIIEKMIDPGLITGIYRKRFYRQWIENIIFSTPELASFSRIIQDQTVQSFVEKDNLQYDISKIQIQSELSQKRPNLDMIAGGSAVAVLRREGNKKRKQMPIRKLLSETGTLVQIIKPCFMMSPLSVSTFLDPDRIRFDTVIFDEASQIFPQDAVGAIYRGSQLIVVGDSRQMPPSNFFNATLNVDEDDEEIGDINDFESILDVCSAVFTTKRLSWHYRSRYEQLITFSNRNFYNNSLVTFPSSSRDHEGIGVDYYYVEGTFDRRTKTNRTEAEFVVDLIYRNIEEHPDRSLGVVAFSIAQQNLIDRMLMKKREADPSYEWFFGADRPEPFFIKNLETVQGDERDTIIFSVAYAKDSQGRFIQNFGPLNREGGERRLNVAVTRAKDNVQLVASIHYTDISLNTTESEGVRLLQAYLNYAQNGEEIPEQEIPVPGEDNYDFDFEQEICDFLQEQGFTVDARVGCSGYKIDLGIRKPDSLDYLMAVECDGATYHLLKNARDRDSLRKRVLENMGWRFYRIWSTDWYRNKAVEKDRLVKAIQEAIYEDARETEPGTDQKAEPENLRGDSRDTREAAPEDVRERFVTEVKETPLTFEEFKETDAVRIILNHNYDYPGAVKEILEAEGPVSEEFLLKRIVSLFGREKVTKTVQQYFNSRMIDASGKGITRRNGFLYLRGVNKYRLRIPGDKREVKYISIEELAAGLYILIKQNVTATREGLYKTLANLLGFSRTGDAIIFRFDEALARLIEAGLVKEENGAYSCVER